MSEGIKKYTRLHNCDLFNFIGSLEGQFAKGSGRTWGKFLSDFKMLCILNHVCDPLSK